MRIALFADSFGTSRNSLNVAWYNLLAEKLNAKLDIFALGGYPTFLCYKKFCNVYENYDQCIFLVSDYAKYTKPVNLETKQGVKFNEHYISGLRNCEIMLESMDLIDNDVELLNMIKVWFLICDDEFLQTVQDLIIQDLLNKKPNTIVLPVSIQTAGVKHCMSEKWYDKLNIDKNWSFWEFHKVMARSLQNEYDVLTFPKYLEIPDKISAHLTFEANKVLANDLYEYIVNGTTLKLPEYIKHDHEINYYYEVKE